MQSITCKTLAALLLIFASTVAWSQSRFPNIPREQLTEAQKQVYDAIAGGPRGEEREVQIMRGFLLKRGASTHLFDVGPWINPPQTYHDRDEKNQNQRQCPRRGFQHSAVKTARRRRRSADPG